MAGWRWYDDLQAVVVNMQNTSVVLLHHHENSLFHHGNTPLLHYGNSWSSYLTSEGKSEKISERLKWRCQDDILVPEVKQLDKNIENAVDLANWGKPMVKWGRPMVEKYQIIRLLNLEDMQREEKRWGENLSLGREWLREKVQEAKSSEVDLVYRNHFERDAEGNLVFPQSSCSRLWSVQLLPNSLPVRAFVSFPGSGNTHPSQPPCHHHRHQHHDFHHHRHHRNHHHRRHHQQQHRRSGNTWLRDLIEAATGLYTGVLILLLLIITIIIILVIILTILVNYHY